jgi:formylglycine-generating enzyme required for sulfatase activity
MTGSAATASRRGAAAEMEKETIDIAETLARLSALTIFELRGEWRRLHRAPPPMRLSRDLLVRGITYKLQERSLGGLSSSILRKLEGLEPAIYVSWDDAKAYVAWLSRMTGKTYRLLTGAEWECAARAGTKTAYYWGNEIGKNNANCDGCGSQWDNKQTAPVGSFKSNAFGLYDMAGNVWQWVEDCYHDDYRRCIEFDRAQQRRNDSLERWLGKASGQSRYPFRAGGLQPRCGRPCLFPRIR